MVKDEQMKDEQMKDEQMAQDFSESVIPPRPSRDLANGRVSQGLELQYGKPWQAAQ